MTANVGRTIIIYWGNESPQPAVAGIREKTISLAGEPVDITNDDSNGWRTLLDAAQVNGLELSVSGVLINDRLRQEWISGAAIGSGTRMQAATLEYPLDAGESTPATLSGTFYLSSYDETGNHDGEITFEATLMSSGAVVYTPGA